MSRIFYEIEFNSIVNFIFWVALRILKRRGDVNAHTSVNECLSTVFLPMFVYGLIFCPILTH